MKFHARIKKRSSLAALELGFAHLLEISGSLTTDSLERQPGKSDGAAMDYD